MWGLHILLAPSLGSPEVFILGLAEPVGEFYYDLKTRVADLYSFYTYPDPAF